MVDLTGRALTNPGALQRNPVATARLTQQRDRLAAGLPKGVVTPTTPGVVAQRNPLRGLGTVIR
jgi:hypothetical protein